MADQPALQPSTISPSDLRTVKQPKTTQRDRIYALLYACRNQWVGLPEILDLRIVQFGSRIKELRELGADIRNRRETKDGTTRSWYMLVSSEAPEVSR